jgi:hypothetical protein
MTPEERLSQILSLQSSIGNSWESISQVIQERKSELLVKLVEKEDPETRGRIKELNFLLELPNRLQQESMSITNHAQQEGEIP